MTTDTETHPGDTGAEPKRRFRFPTAFTVLFFVLVLVWILTFIIKPGTYSYVSCDGGSPKPIPGTFEKVDLVERAAFPAQREMGGRRVAIDLDRDVFDEGAEQLLPVARRGRWRVPDGGEIGSECEQTIALGL